MTDILESPAVRVDAPHRVTGVLDVDRSGQGRLRGPGLLAGPDDVRVTAAQIRRHDLRPGDVVVASAGPRPGVLGDVLLVGGGRPGRPRPYFAELTPVHPHERLRLESPVLTGSGAWTGRVIDLVAPVGKGQRGLIVAPPKAGKTIVLQTVAAALAANHPECRLMVLLVDERPEEVTEMRRRVRAEVIASTFDRPAREHVAVAALAADRARRLVEQGEDVVLLLDSLTRLCRAHNTAAAAGGRTLTGGVDASTLLGPKQLFGAARATQEAGSLTVLATALAGTGSRADDYYYEELKGTGNMELHLDRSLAERRLHPAVDVTASGTRREELLLPAGELQVVRGLRQALAGRDPHTALETLLDRIGRTRDNAAFLRSVQGAVPPPR